MYLIKHAQHAPMCTHTPTHACMHAHQQHAHPTQHDNDSTTTTTTTTITTTTPHTYAI